MSGRFYKNFMGKLRELQRKGLGASEVVFRQFHERVPGTSETIPGSTGRSILTGNGYEGFGKALSSENFREEF